MNDQNELHQKRSKILEWKDRTEQAPRVISFSDLIRQAGLPATTRTFWLVAAADILPVASHGTTKLYPASAVETLKRADAVSRAAQEAK
jgi:hypothetical protein